MRRIQKGFLRNTTVQISKQTIWTLLFYWIFFSIILHLLLVNIAEGLALVLTHSYWARVFDNSKMQRLFSVLFSGISSTMALTFTLLLCIRSISPKNDFKKRKSLRMAYNQIAFNGWLTLHFITRFLFSLSIFLFAFFSHTELVTIEEVDWIVYMLLIVFFLNTTLHFHRVLKKSYFQVLGTLIGISILITATLSTIYPYNHKSLNLIIKRDSVIERHDFRLPIMTSSHYLNERYENRILVTPKSDSESELLWYHMQYSKPVKTDSVSFLTILNESESGFRTINLYLDRRVKYREWLKIRSKMFRYYAISLNVHTVIDTLESEINPLGHKGLNFSSFVSGCDNQSKLIDSLKTKKIDPRRIRWPDQDPCYRASVYRETNRILVEFNSNIIKVNSQTVEVEKLKMIVRQLFQKYKSNSMVLLKPESDITWGRHLEMLDLIRSEIIGLRKSNSDGPYEFHEPYYLRHNPRKIDIEQEYPFNIIELSEINLQLYEYMNSYKD